MKKKAVAVVMTAVMALGMVSAVSVQAGIEDKTLIVGFDAEYFVSEGLLEISNNVVTIIATEAIPADQLDVERAKKEVEELKAKLAKVQEDKDILITQKNLQQALMKVHIAEKLL